MNNLEEREERRGEQRIETEPCCDVFIHAKLAVKKSFGFLNSCSNTNPTTRVGDFDFVGRETVTLKPGNDTPHFIFTRRSLYSRVECDSFSLYLLSFLLTESQMLKASGTNPSLDLFITQLLAKERIIWI